MFYFSVLVGCLLLVLPQARADPRSVPRRYKPLVHVPEEIDVNDITFTTSAPELERSATLKAYPVPLEKVYVAGQSLVVPVAKYKPYKVFKVQEGFRPVLHKAKAPEKGKPSPFEPPTTFPGPDASRHSAKLVPFSGQVPARLPTRPTAFLPQDNKNFVPSPTFSPTVLALINSENRQNFPESPDLGAFAAQTTLEWPKPSRKPPRIKTGRKIPDNHQSAAPKPEDFPATSEKLEDNRSNAAYAESPQQSESFLSEISTIHKGGGAANNLDEVADSLDLKTGERVEFQMYGMDGPQSYKFGFDTGKGQNRHFRFEERDNSGKVKGHYGYLDEDGKMRIMKYEADPVTGFHAGPVEISPEEN